MRINKNNIKDEDKELAIRLLNKLRAGKRVIGNPAEGLKITLRKLDKELADFNTKSSPTEFKIKNKSLVSDINLLKAGISGEEKLSEYLEILIKHNKKINNIIAFASLNNTECGSSSEDFLFDTDFILVYGNHLLILDAKNIHTSPEIPLYIDEENILKNPSKEILALSPSTHIWRETFSKNRIPISSISGCIIIVNDSGAIILKNQTWYQSDCKPMHISDLESYLMQWIEGKDDEASLSLLTKLAKYQISRSLWNSWI